MGNPRIDGWRNDGQRNVNVGTFVVLSNHVGYIDFCVCMTQIRFLEGTNAIANANSYLHDPRRLTDGSALQVTTAETSVYLFSKEYRGI
ncbi:hypothetical protein JMJ77_0013499 [Colletotrichum scovillei]|uniref:Uncharacterized protein n=1 Tax=Colletotrichum scovillei TaxID=1209932 RepID=A0A9P7R955_9PEZI|nr:hypothetical protein JMJ77_0013499 [Colletotrichum scovillei]KAG7069802.1 hypothetical protein JMJ76_0003462 [Colletotrichum scovillei]KAG7073716.1 hypothetical protein JMJ78_0014684 [Colletotrichum scovillei]